MSLFSLLADTREPNSLASRLRGKRNEMFLNMLSTVPRPARVLDVGGTAGFWEKIGFSSPGVEIILLNVDVQPVRMPGFRSIAGDARDLGAFADGSVDVVYSNSVIEHVGDAHEQARMASEIRRVAKRYFVQTPNYWFPVEPHFVFPAFHYLPLDVRARLLTQFRLGWFARERDWDRALEAVSSIRLLTPRRFAQLFPEADVFEERFCGLTKSLIVHYGW